MKLYSIYTSGIEDLYTQFVGSLKDDLDLHIKRYEYPGTGGFLDEEHRTVTVVWFSDIYNAIRDNPGEVIVAADIDILFYNPFKERIVEDLGDCDIALQTNFPADFSKQKIHQRYVRPDANELATNRMNSGWMCIRCNPATEAVFKQVADELAKDKYQFAQVLVNQYVEKFTKWKLLPPQYWHTGLEWPPPDDMVLHHATFCDNIHWVPYLQAKQETFERVRSYYENCRNNAGG